MSQEVQQRFEKLEAKVQGIDTSVREQIGAIRAEVSGNLGRTFITCILEALLPAEVNLTQPITV